MIICCSLTTDVFGIQKLSVNYCRSLVICNNMIYVISAKVVLEITIKSRHDKLSGFKRTFYKSLCLKDNKYNNTQSRIYE